MKIKSSLLLLAAFSIASLPKASAALVALTSGTYTENFNLIATTAAAGWDVRTAANATSLGTVGTYIATPGTGTGATSTEWSATGGAFKNFASASTGASATGAVQAAATDRALGLRQTGAVGDPGGSFSFNFSTVGLNVTTISLDVQMLNVQPRSATWTLSYGVGATPTSFTTLGTYTDPAAFGSTTLVFNTVNFGTGLDNLASAWFRITALTGTTGSGNRDSVAIDNFSITAVPEPDAAVLIGAIGLVGILRRRR